MKKVTKIISSLSALYQFDFISYPPIKEYLEMVWGTNTSHYDKDKYEIKLQKINSFTIGLIESDDKFYYCPERLFIELDKFPLENTIKKEAIEKLEKIINPFIVEKLYFKLIKMRRGLDRERIESYINRKTFNLGNLLVEYENDNKSIIREYIIVLLSNSDDLVTTMTKGGSAIEILSLTKRSTLDIDAHIDKEEILLAIDILENKNNPVYFEIKNKENLNYHKNIIRIDLIPKSRSKIISNLIDEQQITIPLSLNTTYPKEDIIKTINNYNLQKQPLKRMGNYSALIFSKEMILAEKFKSLIFKPETTTRTKDLIDLKLLWDKSVNKELFIRWFYKKGSSDRYPSTKEEAIFIINQNKDKPFVKILGNFDAAIKMYNTKTTYAECIEIYKKLISYFT